MKILLLGATGRTGKLLLKSALQNGYSVHCLVRDSSQVAQAENLTVFEGDVNHIPDLKQAMDGCQAIINTLNISRTSDFPWAPLRTPKTLLSDVMTKVIQIAPDYGIKRIVVCSAWGVLETKKDIPFWFRWMINYSNIGLAYQDHERQEEILENSHLDWTIVRPVGLTNSKKAENVRESIDNHPKPTLTISRKTVADYLLNTIEQQELVQKKIVVSKD